MRAPSMRSMPTIDVVQQPCQVFVALAEEGWTDGGRDGRGRRALPRRRCSTAAIAPDTLVLGCTHFPVLADAIRNAVGCGVRLVDSAATTADAVAVRLSPQRGMAGDGNGKGGARFFATDAPERFARVGAIFLGRGIDAADVTLVDLRP